jgi:hypothetical protein
LLSENSDRVIVNASAHLGLVGGSKIEEFCLSSEGDVLAKRRLLTLETYEAINVIAELVDLLVGVQITAVRIAVAMCEAEDIEVLICITHQYRNGVR